MFFCNASYAIYKFDGILIVLQEVFEYVKKSLKEYP